MRLIINGIIIFYSPSLAKCIKIVLSRAIVLF